MDTQRLLLQLSDLCAVSGHEGEAVAFAEELLRQYGETSITPLGSLVCRVRAAGEGEPHLLLDAHIDEIGMIVTNITEEGFLRVADCGGVDRRLLLASPVVIHAQSGRLNGIVCSVPPHLSGEGDNKNLKVDQIYIDVGLSKAEAEKRIRPGDRVTFYAQARQLLGDFVSGKALDDRAGCVAILYALEQLRGKELKCGLTVQFSSMEEVGGQGARTAAQMLSPTHAVAVDVGFGHTPDAPREKCGELGKGPMIGYAPTLDRTVTQRLAELAERENIPFQADVMGGRTSTNADAISVTGGGVPCGLLSIPEKYMHTPIETVSVRDVENTGRLLAAYAAGLGGER